MKKKQIDEILVNQAKRKSKLFLLICYIAINSIMCILFFMLFVKGNKNYYVKYYETNNHIKSLFPNKRKVRSKKLHSVFVRHKSSTL